MEFRVQFINRVINTLCKPGLALSGPKRWLEVSELCREVSHEGWNLNIHMESFLSETKRVCAHQGRLGRGSYGDESKIDWDRREVSVCNSLLSIIDAARQLEYEGLLYPRCPSGAKLFDLAPIKAVSKHDENPQYLVIDGQIFKSHRLCRQDEYPAGYCLIRTGDREVRLLLRDSINAGDFVNSLNSWETPMMTKYPQEEKRAQLDNRLVIPAPSWQPKLTPEEHVEIQKRILERSRMRAEGRPPTEPLFPVNSKETAQRAPLVVGPDRGLRATGEFSQTMLSAESSETKKSATELKPQGPEMCPKS
jgi:hypothetical protein